MRNRGYKTATLGQWFLDRIKLGELLPLQSLYVLRGNIEVWEAIGDLVRGLCVDSYAPKAILLTLLAVSLAVWLPVCFPSPFVRLLLYFSLSSGCLYAC